MSKDIVAGLVACPFCGGRKGYTLDNGNTYRWWEVRCGKCGELVTDCRSDHRTTFDKPKPARWEAADNAWNSAGAYAERQRELVRWAYTKLHTREFSNLDDALKLDEMKLLLEHGI
jgi:hypothetical protein